MSCLSKQYPLSSPLCNLLVTVICVSLSLFDHSLLLFSLHCIPLFHYPFHPSSLLIFSSPLSFSLFRTSQLLYSSFISSLLLHQSIRLFYLSPLHLLLYFTISLLFPSVSICQCVNLCDLSLSSNRRLFSRITSGSRNELMIVSSLLVSGHRSCVCSHLIPLFMISISS